MELFKDPYSFMMLSSIMKTDNNYISIFLIIITIICKLIPFYEISEYIKKYIFENNNEVYITISSHEVPVTRTWSHVPITKLIYSKKFLSIIHFIHNSKNINFISCTEIMAYNSELNNNHGNDDNIINEFIFMPLSKQKFNIYENIYCNIINFETKDENENDKNKKNSNIPKKNHFIINLSINDCNNGINILKKFIEKCTDEYNLFINSNKDENKLCIYEYKNSEKSESNLELNFNEYYLEHNKDLDINIFFEGKEKLLNYLKPFIYDPLQKINIGEEKYKKSGFTFKAGLLFYGHPGCGKTSTIKAILKKTNRNAIIINLSKVKTCEDLEAIFRRRTIKGKQFDGKQLCYILEDCDAFENNIIQSREEKKIEIKNNQSPELNEISKFMESTAINLKDIVNSEDKINLSCFLNILDGIVELNGVMIIMTTNHPEKIDKALIRPGRFDFKYEFKKTSKKIIKEMLKFKYELTDKQINGYFEKINIKDEVLSPAEIQSICFRNENIEDCINEILYESQK
jgi:hypothetical protein